MFESLKSLLHPSLFTRLKVKIFHKSEISRVKKILFRSILIYLGLNVLTAVIFYFDLQHFATTNTSSQPLTLSSNLLNLSDLLSTAYGNPDLSMSIYSILTIISFVITFIWLELTIVWGLLRSWVWRPLSVISKLVLALISHILLIIPILVLLFIPSLLISNLESQAILQVQSYHSSLRESASDPRFLSDPSKIESELKSLVPPPTLISGDFTKNSILLKANLANLETFYRGIIIPNVINKTGFVELPSAAFLVDKKHLLLSNKLSKEQLNQILPAYSLAVWDDATSSLSLSLPTSKKSPPKINFLDTDEYNSIQQSKLDTQKKKLESYIASTKSSIAQNNKYIIDTQNSLDDLESEKAEYSDRVNLLLANCREVYESTSCDEAERVVSQNQQEYDREIASVKQYIIDAQSIAPVLQAYLSRAQQSYNNFLKYPIIPEVQVGIFDPPNNISIKYEYNNDNPRLPLDYYYVLLHELAHYYSNQNNLELPSFLEEGITDYLALLLGQQYAPNTTSRDGYPEELKIAQTLSAKLGQEKLLKLYFDKSPLRWKSEFSKLCGQDCYSKFVKIGENLTFASLDDIGLRRSLVDQAIATLSTP